MKKILYIILIALLSVVAGLAKATPLSGSGTETAPYIIATTADWTEFCDNHATYKNSYIKMANFVTAATNKYFNDTFSGTFDGDGYTLTVNISGGRVAPFMQVSNGTIKNLRVAGSITGSANHTSGLISFCTSNTTCTIQNCIVSATITNNGNLGGFIGHGFASTTINITDCVFNGTLSYSGANNNTDKNTRPRKVGGFVSWEGDATSTYNMSRCLFDGTINCTAGFTPFIVKYASCNVSGSDAASCLYTVAKSSGFPSQYTVFDGTSATELTAEQIVTTMNNAGGNGWRVFKGKAEPTMRPLRTLGNIPDGWTVTANGDTITVTNGTAIITEGDTVVLTPTNPALVKNVTLTDAPTPTPAPVFSVSATKTVVFAPGNLQYKSSEGWRFAEHQYDYIGTWDATDWVDYFGWGTWGEGKDPLLTSTDNADYEWSTDFQGTLNGHNDWYTLSNDEWIYLFQIRTNASSLYGTGTVNGVNGVIILPDGSELSINTSHNNWSNNTIDAATWNSIYEAEGAVFLPGAGRRSGTGVGYIGAGVYWSSTPQSSDSQRAHDILFNNGTLNVGDVSRRYFGYSVRLVKDVTASSTACRRILLDTVQHNLVAQDCDTLTGELQHNVKISIADGATVTLDGVTINGTNNESYRWAGITCLGNVTITLKDGTTNTVKGFYNEYPGVFVYDGYTLTINGGGTLIASSNGHGAGIGGGYNISCGNIDIQGGIIEATGGYHAAGIGGGHIRNCGTITITDGVTRVTATKGTDAPNSIGIGYRDNENTCGTITFGNQQMYDGSEWTTTPTNGQTYGGLKFSIKTTTITDDTWELTCRRVDLSQITADSVMQDGDVLTGTLTANVKISIADGATVTLNNVTINGTNNSNYKWAGITCLGDATIILSGTNTVKGFYQDYPGIQAAAGKTLIINGTDSLIASSNGYSSGIGGGSGVACGNIEIQGGTITATGGQRGAGIGGAYNASWGNITISGGTVTATGGENAAGIGGGRRFTANVSSGNIHISGGTVNATGGEYAAGIGGGRGNNNNYKSSCGTITITTDVTKVTATKGGDDAPNSIGAGYLGTCGTVTIGGTQGAKTDSTYTYQP